MTKTLQIDFVSDVACPWCAVGLASLQEALKRTAGDVDADLHFQPFELNPDMTPEGENLMERMAKTRGTTPEQAAANRAAIKGRAAEVGFEINTDETHRMYNTFDAHRLIHWAGLEGRQAEMKRALLEAYFTQRKNPSDHDVLVGAAEAAGLDGNSAREVLASGRFADEVRAAEGLWRSRGISSVPSIIINSKYLISGGQPAEVFEQALRKIAAEA